MGTRYFFSCQFDEAVTLRAWYQQLHGDFADDNAVHLFDPNNLGFQAILACVLSEVHEALPGLQLTEKTVEAINRKEYRIGQLVNYDIGRANEPIEIEPQHKRSGSVGITSPYNWV